MNGESPKSAKQENENSERVDERSYEVRNEEYKSKEEEEHYIWNLEDGEVREAVEAVVKLKQKLMKGKGRVFPLLHPTSFLHMTPLEHPFSLCNKTTQTAFQFRNPK